MEILKIRTNLGFKNVVLAPCGWLHSLAILAGNKPPELRIPFLVGHR